MEEERTMTRMKIVKLVSSILLCQMAGVIGSLFVMPSLPWYDTLAKPSWAPSGTVISIIWTTLFTLMGISLYLVWMKGIRTGSARLPLSVFGIQLAVNVAWNYFFFGLQSPLFGLIVILILWVLIAVNIVAFARISRVAGALLIPYIIWVSIAATANYYLLILNL